MDRGIRYDLSGRRIRLWRREGRSSVSVRLRKERSQSTPRLEANQQLVLSHPPLSVLAAASGHLRRVQPYEDPRRHLNTEDFEFV
jgi:hypothetical protein